MIFDHPVIRVLKNIIHEYGRVRVIFNNMVIHVRTNKIYEEHAVFLHLIDEGVHSTFV